MPVSIFPRSIERLYLGFSLAALIFSVAVPTSFMGPSTTGWVQLIVPYLFFDLTHHGFTFVTLLVLPEGRQFFKESLNKSSPWVLGLGILIVFLVLWRVSEILHFRIAPFVKPGAHLFLLSLFAQHAISQTLGLSLLYNRHAAEGLSEAERKQILNCEAKERLFFKIFLNLGIFSRCLDLFPESVNWAWTREVINIAFLVATLPIIGTAFFYPSKIWLHKKLFLLRVLLFPLSAWFPLAGIAEGVMHGTEYGLVTATMANHSTYPRRKLVPLLLLLIAMAATVPIFVRNDPKAALQILGGWTQWPVWLSTPLFLAFFCIRYTHFYVDRFLYRTRDESVRKNITPLLLKMNLPS